MDKQTLSNYGWVIITVLVLAVMIALATPFGTYVKEGAKSTLTGLFESSENALNTGLNEAGVTLNKAEFGGVPTVGGNANTEETIVGSVKFYGYYDDDYNSIDEPITLTWEELQLPENGDKYSYDASKISNTSIGASAFWCCDQLASIIIPDTVTSIDDDAFSGCTGLTNITIPNSVTSIGSSAFNNCYNLVVVTIPDSVTSIGNGAFYWCNNLTIITISDGVASIGAGAFSCCYSFMSITIPNSVTTIGDGAFSCCEDLTSITFDGTKAQWNAISLGNYWNDEVPATVVHCTDGDVAI